MVCVRVWRGGERSQTQSGYLLPPEWTWCTKHWAGEWTERSYWSPRPWWRMSPSAWPRRPGERTNKETEMMPFHRDDMRGSAPLKKTKKKTRTLCPCDTRRLTCTNKRWVGMLHVMKLWSGWQKMFSSLAAICAQRGKKDELPTAQRSPTQTPPAHNEDDTAHLGILPEEPILVATLHRQQRIFVLLLQLDDLLLQGSVYTLHTPGVWRRFCLFWLLFSSFSSSVFPRLGKLREAEALQAQGKQQKPPQSFQTERDCLLNKIRFYLKELPLYVKIALFLTYRLNA